jgi:diguanylate cyclase (GGDEF)-like protein
MSIATLLLIDDNPTNLRVATEYLRSNQFEILTARDGRTGIERAKLAKPDLILLDVQMPGLDGFATCELLKKEDELKQIPVLFMTAQTDVEAVVKGFAVGAVDYITKPVQVAELVARVNTHLTISRLQRELFAEIAERRQTEDALRKANQELHRLAVLDELTQIANRRRFDQYLEAQWNQPQHPALSLLLCDVDYFKRYNDHYGHQAGDHCLHMVAQTLSRVVSKAKDLVARYGGEEFAAILPDTDLAGAVRVAEGIRAELHKLRIPHEYSAAAPIVTLSIGAASIVPGPHNQPSEVIATADAALYRAKAEGRDRVVW